jgi:hypothetical protein
MDKGWRRNAKNIGKESEQRENYVVLQQISLGWGRKFSISFFSRKLSQNFIFIFAKKILAKL